MVVLWTPVVAFALVATVLLLVPVVAAEDVLVLGMPVVALTQIVCVLVPSAIFLVQVGGVEGESALLFAALVPVVDALAQCVVFVVQALVVHSQVPMHPT